MEAAAYLDQGQLVPDELVVEIVASRLADDDCTRGYLFDGFPRTLPQAAALDKLLDARDAPLEACIEFMVPHEELLKRLSQRGRADDAEETVRKRLREYAELTRPLANYYDDRGILRGIDAVGTLEEVFGRIMIVLQLRDVEAEMAMNWRGEDSSSGWRERRNGHWRRHES